LTPRRLEFIGSAFFALAILQIYSVRFLRKLARQQSKGSARQRLFHLLGEVEVVFGAWAAGLVVLTALVFDAKTAFDLVEKRDFSEPLFVFAVMSVASTRPVVAFASNLINWVSLALPLKRDADLLFSTLTVGPLLGSLITEPAAMTVTAVLLREHYFGPSRSKRLKYAIIGTLFVNVSIGGVLTNFAAPPVLMIARIWHWDSLQMLKSLGWKAFCACLITSAIVILIHQREPREKVRHPVVSQEGRPPLWLQILHLGVLAAIVATAHHPAVFIGLLLFFLGLVDITKQHQSELLLKESLLISFFLAGLVVLGGLQSWWLKPLVSGLSNGTLFVGTVALTSFTDNAALTYLGAQIPDVTENFKYAIVAGAVAGGGLTVIANAPNLTGYSVLRDRFGGDGISAGRLFLGALIPTGVAMACFWFL
jgi:Na+/H+ antiporter NhaD/arsenite permease-like protein